VGALKGLPTAPTAPRTVSAPEDLAPEETAFAREELVSTGRAPQEGEAFFEEFLDSDEEEAAISQIKHVAPTFKHTSLENEIEARITKNIQRLRAEFPQGGFRAYRFITYDILRDAPADYFLRYEEDVRAATSWVQGQLSEKGLADYVGEAQANPLDDAIQDKAFRHAQAVTSEYLERLPYKGFEKMILVYMISCDILGLSRLDALWNDRSIDEILCNGPHDVQVEIKGQLHQVRACQFRDTAHLHNLLERLFGSISKTVTKTTPLVKGRLYDNSRMFAVHQSIAPQGPNFSIRRHPEKFWRPIDLVEYGSASPELLTDVGNMIYKGCSYIVIGGTSTGKTSLLNATSGFFDPDQRVLSLEDNLELRLNPKKLVGAPMETRQPNPNNPEDRGVTMRDLVKGSLQMRPDGIVIGEVTDGAMYDLCQALNTGHWGCSTVHANSPQDGIYRMVSLVTQAELITGDAALPLIAAAFDFIIMVEHFPVDGSRKVTSVSEINPYPEMGEDGRYQLGLDPLWEFVPEELTAEDKVVGDWHKVGELSDIRRKRRHLDLTKSLTWEELLEISDVPPEFQPKEPKELS